MNLDSIVKVFKKSTKAVILPHIAADGDAIGSALALRSALAQTGLESVIYVEEKIPFLYSFLPGIDEIKIYDGGRLETDFDLAIALDTGDRDRLGKRKGLFDAAPVNVNIDHHSTNTAFGIYNHIDITASAVGEIIYRLIQMLEVELDRDRATCLYVAIATDTGGFRFSNTTPETHRITAELLGKGVDVAEVSRKIFDTVTFEKVKLMGEAIGSIRLFENGQAAMIVLTDEMILRTGASEEDCEGIVDIARKIQGVEVAIMLRSRSDGTVKGNLRSHEKVDVSAIARFFGGGGHVRAAGFTSHMQLSELIEQISQRVAEALKNS